MKIAFMHYHLKTGGVTTVIGQQVAALNAAGGEALVLAGEESESGFPADAYVVPGLGYDTQSEAPCAVDDVVRDILHGLFHRWPQGPDLVHVHNPTLAKNRNLQSILKALQQSGLKLLCQIHDLAEDGRPAVYYQEPYVADCHYAVINQRDHRLMRKAGLKSKGCHLLPNAISPIAAARTTTDPSKSAPVLYPIRAIRRKNIGEAILISLFFKERTPLAITLPPNSPQDIQAYNQWRKFVADNDLNVEFEVGLKTDFSALMGSCRYVLTTSITEGFGFAFLEAWTAGKGLWGRLLPEICSGFMAAGIELDHLYRNLWVPLAWMDSPDLARRWTSAMADVSRQYGFALSADQINTGWQAVSLDDRIDFGLLSESFQKEVILHIISNRSAPETLIRLNPWLSDPGPPRACEQLITRNSNAVVRNYGFEKYMRRLMGIYKDVVSTPVNQQIDKPALVGAFLSPADFSLLKWESLDVY